MNDRVFVFGSNLAGRHGRGAALHAKMYEGAIYGQGIGLQGNSYAIPTKDKNFASLPLDQIRRHVDVFIAFAKDHPAMQFNITRVGCGLAGYKDEQIAPMFFTAPSNCWLPKLWRQMRDAVQK